jgi:peroxiredoxin
MYLTDGQPAPAFNVVDVLQNTVRLGNLKGKKIFLAFLRNTQCPICSLYVYQLLTMTDTLRQHNVEMVLFYESSPNLILVNPFFKEKILKEANLHVVSDSERTIYSLYGAEISPEKSTFEALQAGGKLEIIQKAAQLGFNGNGQEEGTHPDAIPAEFLISEQGGIVRAYYGTDAADHLPLKDVEAFALWGA